MLSWHQMHNPIQDNDTRMDTVDGMDKDKEEEKKKEPVFFMGVELVDLDDCDVLDMKLQCNNNDTDDDDASKPEGMDVSDGGASSFQCLELNLGPTMDPVQCVVPFECEHSPEATPSIMDPLFNVVGKAPHPDAVTMKQEAGWF